MFKNQIQKSIFCFICLILIVSIIVKMFPNEYSRMAYVDSINNNCIKMIDSYGNLWLWEKEEKENFYIGEKVKLTFNNNKTDEDVTDDIILKIEKEEINY